MPLVPASYPDVELISPPARPPPTVLQVYEERLRNADAPHYGRVASDAWAGEHWPTLKARAHTCMNTGKGIWTDEDAFFVRSVETYWSWRWSPILGPRGEKCAFRPRSAP